MRKIDAARVLELFTYDAATGALFWRKRATEGPVGTLTHKGYITIPIEGKNYRAHRIVWAMHYGDTIPEGMMIDHINGDRADNRVENLRLATPRQNALNTHSKAASASGFRGVTRRRGENKWRAQIRIDGKQTSLGYFHTPEEAHAAYCKAAAEMHGEFARRDSVLVAEGLERDAREVADSLIDTMIDISESNEGCEFTEEGHRKAVSMAQEAIRQNEWFWGGRPKPAPQPQPPINSAETYSNPVGAPAHGDGEVLGFLRKFDADFIARKQHGQCQVIIYQERPRKDAVPLYTATRPTPEAQEARDAARYRWLRQFDIGIDHQGYDDYRWYAYAKPEPRNGRLGLDAVIDAALALPAQGEGNRG